jgi:tetratricopeptide (TPR) repeat protein
VPGVDESAYERLELARHYVDVERPQRALDALGDVGEDALEDSDYWQIRAEALLDLERWDEAAEAAKSGLAVDPEDVVLLDVLAISRLEGGWNLEAREAIGAALEIVPDHPSLLAHKALIEARRQEFDAAEVTLARALEVAPESADVRRVRAQVAFLRGDRDAAKQYADELLEVEPESDLSHLLRGNVDVEAGRFKTAVRHFEEAARLNPEHPEIREVLRENRVAAHPILAPVRPIWRFGRMRSWLVYFTLAGLLAAAGFQKARIVVAVVWVVIVLISWLAPPILRRWYGRKHGF